QRAHQLRDEVHLRERALRRAHDGCLALEDGVYPDVDLVKNNAALCRPSVLEASRRARTREALVRLMPFAAVVDPPLSALIARLAQADPALRAAAVELYLQITGGAASDDKERLLVKLRATGQDDLVLAALSRGDMLRAHLSEYL